MSNHKINTALLLILLALICAVLCVTSVRASGGGDSPPASPEVQKSRRTLPPPHEATNPESTVYLGQCTVTHYDVCAACCGKTDGITASGTAAVPYTTAAVDPEIIPLGSILYADYGDGIIHRYLAEDVGGGVRGNHIDLCVSSHQEALELGVRTAEIRFVPPEEDA